ncbi:glutathione synthase [Beggiatoa leptomitoformis]|uniref:Glutathione synthetase n=1 Tax=Beggiatoa leptomitoformis TaxID=288004 RepID=A0A2N9YJC6_9GAMM|nr:glutathione synthase [Beggiatoa leptomitoformis]ALG69464.1 glutathione synthase [Beggiatoa leptomitoformis]AUI70627.1 glutathione synthase [Beggiatoa leptomitoformis]
MSAFNLGIVMDPIASIKTYKDSSFAMLLAAQQRGWTLWYMEMQDLWLRDGIAYATMRRVQVRDNKTDWFSLETAETRPLHSLSAILMRKDPPFDLEYIVATYILEQAEQRGTLIVNRPQGLRDANEKAYTAWFPHCCPPTLMTRSAAKIREFLQEHGEIILKPLDGMGGMSIFRVAQGDMNLSVIIETLTARESRYCMVQRFIPEITQGDKRILLINGEPVPYALARIPAQGESRGNLAAGATGVAQPLTARDRWICQQVGSTLREKGFLFVGLDVIGDYLTEINVTSPTGIRELNNAYGLDIAGQLMDAIMTQLG